MNRVTFEIPQQIDFKIALGSIAKPTAAAITPSAVTFSLAGTSVTATPGDAVLTESEET